MAVSGIVVVRLMLDLAYTFVTPLVPFAERIVAKDTDRRRAYLLHKRLALCHL